ncbi:hypothetical protein ABIF38_005662 [Bradyrhizobium japonicum]|jgi:hypothetical protein|uniref:Uncharacterized protein n=1 Tax=Bradyrhizobium elkanii TaxID=29448 RepID=A0A4Q4K210_BRAEL|nr:MULTISPECIES: hypothetical protein [Bradyrhizobium]MBP1296299.1 hypothetical protein [Bradyrhizobium elkanii]MBP2434733.1 hypothetical protein [Bradyrhizobium elkanii]MCP1732028.1 hypothetical protein [Bradyrhizobium elkanii]MCP1749694.1 hypothetical protein [Bradyrhizobium elkanii]MCP1932802.1 hypothetical protein [Bradyrhizobium elkanii]
MKWMKERDLLIAQTMAFVQSVKGKLPDAELPAPARQTAPPAAQPTATPPAATPAPAALPTAAEQALAEAIATFSVKPAAEVRAAVVPPPLPVPTVIEGLPPAPSPLAVTVVEVPPQPAQLPHFARLDISGDFGSEVRERVANFRAQQQRFLKEREEYCTTTMAKVRAAINELPRSGK